MAQVTTARVGGVVDEFLHAGYMIVVHQSEKFGYFGVVATS